MTEPFSYIVCTVFLERWGNVDRQRQIPEGLADQKVVVAVSCRHYELTKDLKEVEWWHCFWDDPSETMWRLAWGERRPQTFGERWGESQKDGWIRSPRVLRCFALVCLCPSLLSVFITVVMDGNQWAWLSGLKSNLNPSQLFKTGQSKTSIWPSFLKSTV